jgi:hypothetical protein
MDNQSHQAMYTYDFMLTENEEQTTPPNGNIDPSDKLSYIEFDPELLAKFRQRNPPPARPAVLATWPIDDTDPLLKSAYSELQCFARRGGPDLVNLRGVWATSPFPREIVADSCF